MGSDDFIDANNLIETYILLFEEKYKHKPEINRVRAKWFFIEVIDDLGGLKTTQNLLKFYFKTARVGHDLQYFMNNYTEIRKSKRRSDEDKLRTNRLMRESESRVNGN